jgi:hypothetical protein
MESKALALDETGRPMGRPKLKLKFWDGNGSSKAEALDSMPALESITGRPKLKLWTPCGFGVHNGPSKAKALDSMRLWSP